MCCYQGNWLQLVALKDKPNCIKPDPGSKPCSSKSEPSGGPYRSDSTGDAPKEIDIENNHFKLVCKIVPYSDGDGTTTYAPQGRYGEKNDKKLHNYGDGCFCRFVIDEKWNECKGVYAITVNDVIKYIGASKDLGWQFSCGYGIISPANCYIGGQITNCRINSNILKCDMGQSNILLYFFEIEGNAAARNKIKKMLNRSVNPDWYII